MTSPIAPESPRRAIARARASVRALELQLSYCTVLAPSAGLVTRRTVEAGQIVQPGQTLMMLIPSEDVWVTANFKETQLRDVRPGQEAEIEVDVLTVLLSDAPVADRPFVTLDPLSRRLRLPTGREAILVDTVGFIRDLPEDLIAAFRATLEEAGEADLLLNVVDASSPHREDLLRCVEGLLEDMGFHRVPRITVWNKCDLLSEAEAATVAKRYGGVTLSAITRSTLPRLLRIVAERIETLAPLSFSAP